MMVWTISLIFLLTQSQMIQATDPSTDPYEGPGQYSYIEVQFLNYVWNDNYEMSDSSEFQSLSGFFKEKVSEATGILSEYLYDVWFYPGTDTNGNIDSSIVKGELKVNTSSTAGIVETDVQDNLMSSGYFANANVWTEGPDDELDDKEPVTLCGNLTLSSNITWNQDFSIRNSSAFNQVQTNLGQEIYVAGQIPTFDDVDLVDFQVLEFYEASYAVIANFVMYLQSPPGKDNVNDALLLFDLVESVVSANVDDCSPDMPADYDEDTWYVINVRLTEISWKIEYDDPLTAEYLELQQTVLAQLNYSIGDLAEVYIDSFREGSTYAKVYAQAKDSTVTMEQLEGRLQLNSFFDGIQITEEGEENQTPATETDPDGGQEHYSYIEVEFFNTPWNDNYYMSDSSEFQSLSDFFKEKVVEVTNITEERCYDVWFWSETNAYGEVVVKGELKVNNTGFGGINEADVQQTLLNSGHFADARVWTEEPDDGQLKEQFILCGNLTLSSENVWNTDLSDKNSISFGNLEGILNTEVNLKSTAPSLADVDINSFTVLRFLQQSPGSDVILATYLLDIETYNDTNLYNDVKIEFESMDSVDIATVKACSPDVVAEYEEDTSGGKQPVTLCGNLTLSSNITWNQDFSIRNSSAFNQVQTNLGQEIYVAGQIPSFDDVDLDDFQVLEFYETSYAVIANFVMYLQSPPGKDNVNDALLLFDLVGSVVSANVDDCSPDMPTDYDEDTWYVINVRLTEISWKIEYDDPLTAEYLELQQNVLAQLNYSIGDLAEVYVDSFREGSTYAKVYAQAKDSTVTMEQLEGRLQLNSFFDGIQITEEGEENQIPATETDPDGGQEHYSYIEVEFFNTPWNDNYYMSDSSEFQSLSDFFKEKVVEVTDITEERCYDVWFWSETNAYGEVVVKGELKVNNTGFGGINEADVQQTLLNSGHFADARVWTEEPDDGQLKEQFVLCGNLTLSSENVWNTDLSDKNSVSFGNLEGNLNTEVNLKSTAPSLADVDINSFTVLRFLQQSPGSDVILATYLLDIETYNDTNLYNDVKIEFESMDSVDIATVKACSPDVVAEYEEDTSGGKQPVTLCGNLTLSSNITWNQDFSNRDSSAFNQVQTNLGQEIYVAGQIPSFDDVDLDDFQVLEFYETSYAVIANFVMYLQSPPGKDNVNDALLLFDLVGSVVSANVDDCSPDMPTDYDEEVYYTIIVQLPQVVWNDAYSDSLSDDYLNLQTQVLTKLHDVIGHLLMNLHVVQFYEGSTIAEVSGQAVEGTVSVEELEILLESQADFSNAQVTISDYNTDSYDSNYWDDYNTNTNYPDYTESSDYYSTDYDTNYLYSSDYYNTDYDTNYWDSSDYYSTDYDTNYWESSDYYNTDYDTNYWESSDYGDMTGSTDSMESTDAGDYYTDYTDIMESTDSGIIDPSTSYSSDDYGMESSVSDYDDIYPTGSTDYLDSSDYSWEDSDVMGSESSDDFLMGSSDVFSTSDDTDYTMPTPPMSETDIFGSSDSMESTDAEDEWSDFTDYVDSSYSEYSSDSDSTDWSDTTDWSEWSDSTEWSDTTYWSEWSDPTDWSDTTDWSEWSDPTDWSDSTDWSEWSDSTDWSDTTDWSDSTIFPDSTDWSDSMESTESGWIDPSSTTWEDSTEVPEIQSPQWSGYLTPEIGTSVVVEGGKRKLAVTCDCEIKDDYEYEFIWFGDEDEVFKSQKMTADAARNYLIAVEQFELNGQYALDLEYTCEVRVYSFSGELVYSEYSESEAPVKYNSSTPVAITRGDDTDVTAEFDLPLICQEDDPCYIIVKMTILDDDNTCGEPSLAVKGSSEGCGIKIFGSQNGDVDIGEKSIKLSMRNNDKSYQLAKTNFKARVKIETFGSVESFFAGTFSEDIEVTVNDGDDFWKSSHCHASNDPRHRTFDGLSYSLNSIEGTFLMYKNEKKSAEVHITTQSCSEDWTDVKCVCAVYIRSGKDVFAVNLCSPPYTFSYLQKTEQNSLYVEEKFDSTFLVHFPYGTIVYVSALPPNTLGFPMINVVIFPSPSDTHHVQGLCGDLDGDMSNDLQHKDDAGQTNVNVDAKGWQSNEPTAFAESFRVPAGDVLFDEDNLQNLESLTDDERYCACTENEQVCSAHEKRTCDDLDDEFDHEADRRKRSTKGREIEGYQLEQHELSRRMKLWEEHQLRSASVTRKKRQSDECPILTRDEAREECTTRLTDICSKVFVDTQSIKDHTDQIEACALDKKDTCQYIAWEWSSCNVALAVLTNEVSKDKEIASEDRTNIEQNIINCPNQCNGKGTCTASGCECDTGYGDDDCSFNTASPPTPDLVVSVEVTTEYTPDEKPTKVTLSTLNGFSASGKCKVLEITITLPGNEVTTETLFFDLIRISVYEAECPIPTSSRRRRSTESGSSSAVTSYQVSASNDGTTYGSSVDVTVLDSTCLTHNATTNQVAIAANYCLINGVCYLNGVNKTGETCSFCDVSANVYDWTLESGYCLIDGACYANGTIKSDDSCKLCHVDVENDEWTRDNLTDSCEDSDDSGSGTEGYIIAIIVIVVVIVLAAGAVGGYFLWNKYKFSKLRGTGLFDTVPKNKFSLRVEPSKKELLAMEGIDIDPETGHDGVYHPKPAVLPPLYVTANLPVPNPQSEAAPSNLYSERGTIDSLGTLTPAMASNGQGERPHTPNMPNIEG